MQRHQILAIAAVLMAAPVAHADSTCDDKAKGVNAAREGNWELAAECFSGAYVRDPRPLTLYNLAAAQEHLNKLVEARTTYTRFLLLPATGDTEQFRKLGRDALANLDTAIPTLLARATGLVTGDLVELDGRTIELTSAAIPINPGSHTLVVRRGGESIVQRNVTLARGEHANVELPVPQLVPPRITPPPSKEKPSPLDLERPQPQPESRSQSGGMFRSGWFWGTAAAVVVATAATVYYLTPNNRDPTHGTLGPGVLPVP